ncbi:hypothetical protein JANAI62_25330 [Jannaschia pagri]|uniref:Uncharacterized protein n=1 Tax=Jannaschia pagri TaxID=2829797 RepID=A0ABQ4NNR7_9RHOB|nr:hypothetical protein JANAI61_25330 [Jannaschia sp. AI_61]GIT95910.1 hypothetical protein JANAI62_25330 [Jannaschia sp. AI_62]
MLFCALLPYVFGVYGSIISDAAVASEGGLSTAPGEIAALTRAALTTGSGLLAYVAVSVPLTLAWITMIALLFQKPTMVTQPAKLQPHTDPRHVETPPEERKPDMSKGKLPEPKLPSIGAAMKLYIAADWIVMRLLGAGLLWTGYVLWQLIEAERWSRVAALSYGQNPMHALYAYAGIGALMATPFLLPRFITAPRHVAGGLLKAMLLVGSALVLLPMLHVAIELYTPDLYWATLHATVPSVFKGVAAVAVTSALLISFFRQLGSTPKVDYSGKPVMILSGQQLKDLRDARANR